MAMPFFQFWVLVLGVFLFSIGYVWWFVHSIIPQLCSGNIPVWTPDLHTSIGVRVRSV